VSVKTFEFTVPGIPIGKERPRAARVGGFIRMYTPKKSLDYETDVAFKASQVMGDHPPLELPVQMTIKAYYPIAASWTKKKQQQALSGQIVPGKPDLDNVAKAVLDALNGVAYVDDKQVVRLSLTKEFSFEPRVEVRIAERLT
jgi:Holliday junction resolvase RusA-like endonuclease